MIAQQIGCEVTSGYAFSQVPLADKAIDKHTVDQSFVAGKERVKKKKKKRKKEGKLFWKIYKTFNLDLSINFLALNLSDSTSGKQNKNTPEWEIKSQFILDAAYLSTYLIAITQQHTQLFLTLVGIESNNNKQNIYDSLFLAHQKWARHESGRLKSVKLIVNDLKDLSKPFLKNLRANNVPYRLIVYTNGVPKIIEKFVHMNEEL